MLPNRKQDYITPPAGAPTRMALLLLLVVAFLPRAVDAFPSTTFTHTFHFPGIAYDLGVRHIHTPESLGCTKPLLVPGFALGPVDPPVVTQGYSMVTFGFRTMFGGAHARMMTDSRCSSHLILSGLSKGGIPNTPVCVVQLDVAREGAHGHSITARAQFFDEAPLWGRLLFGAAMHKPAWEAAMRWGYASRSEDPQLQLYRARVLLLDATG